MVRLKVENTSASGGAVILLEWELHFEDFGDSVEDFEPLEQLPPLY